MALQRIVTAVEPLKGQPGPLHEVSLPDRTSIASKVRALVESRPGRRFGVGEVEHAARRPRVEQEHPLLSLSRGGKHEHLTRDRPVPRSLDAFVAADEHELAAGQIDRHPVPVEDRQAQHPVVASGGIELHGRRAGQGIAEAQFPDPERREESAWRDVPFVAAPAERRLDGDLFEASLACHALDEEQPRTAAVEQQPDRLALVSDADLDHRPEQAAAGRRHEQQRNFDPVGTGLSDPDAAVPERLQHAQASERTFDPVGVVPLGEFQVPLEPPLRLGSILDGLGGAEPHAPVAGRGRDCPVHPLDGLRRCALGDADQAQ